MLLDVGHDHLALDEIEQGLEGHACSCQSSTPTSQIGLSSPIVARVLLAMSNDAISLTAFFM